MRQAAVQIDAGVAAALLLGSETFVRTHSIGAERARFAAQSAAPAVFATYVCIDAGPSASNRTWIVASSQAPPPGADLAARAALSTRPAVRRVLEEIDAESVALGWSGAPAFIFAASSSADFVGGASIAACAAV